MFKLYLQPFASEPADAAEFYELFGRFTVLWGRLDSTIEFVLAVLVELLSASAERPARMPAPFKDKIKLWRRLYRKLPELTATQRSALKFADDATALSNVRHRLILAVIGFSGRNPAASAIQYKQDGADTLYRRFKIEKSDLERLLIETNQLLQALAPLTLDAWSLHIQPERSSPSPERAKT